VITTREIIMKLYTIVRKKDRGRRSTQIGVEWW
jgi:hypothetical protein